MEGDCMAAGTARGVIPIDYDIDRYWMCSALLLTSGKYGLVVTYKYWQSGPRRGSQKHAVIKGKEFNTPDEAYQYALEWVEVSGQAFIRSPRGKVAPDDLD